MAQHKLENDFRDKLNQREIEPSANAWDRLDAMLTVAEKPKRNYNWLYIAASILGFLFIGIAFLSQTEEMTDVGRSNNPVTIKENTTTDTVKENGTKEININPIKNETVAETAERNQSSVKNHHQNQSDYNHQSNPITNEALPVIENQNQIAERQNNPEPVINQGIKPEAGTKKGVEINVDELLASVSNKTKKPAADPAVKVNANSLLSQVDGEITLTFRERVIRTANKKYQNVKVALANRNKE